MITKMLAVATTLFAVVECRQFRMESNYTLSQSFPADPKSLHFNEEEKKHIMEFAEIKKNKDLDNAFKIR